jgi:protein required for attachment to host cells
MTLPAPAVEHGPDALLVFVDTASARLIPLGPSPAAHEVRLESEVGGHHRQGGWALLAQSRYQRHLQQQRERHFKSVAAAVAQVGDGGAVRHLVLAGEPRNVGLFRRHLPAALAARVVGDMRAARHDAASVLAERGAEMVERASREAARADVDAVLDGAATGRHAAAGLTAALEAVARGAVQTLYLLAACREVGVVCRHCGAMQVGMKPACALCGRAVRPVELQQAMREEVVAAGGEVRLVTEHAGLARYDGVAARLRFPL